jgi:hypothetical protein
MLDRPRMMVEVAQTSSKPDEQHTIQAAHFGPRPRTTDTAASELSWAGPRADKTRESTNTDNPPPAAEAQTGRVASPDRACCTLMPLLPPLPSWLPLVHARTCQVRPSLSCLAASLGFGRGRAHVRGT